MTVSIKPESWLQRHDDVFAAAVDDELVMLNLDQQYYLGLDAIGRRIWELLETPCQLGTLCQRMSEEYDEVPDRIARDVTGFIEEMMAEGMVHTVEG